MTGADAPVIAEVIRSGFVESRHHGRVVGLRVDGSIEFAVGDVHAPVLPRSTLKPLQVVGLLDAGWRAPDAEALAVAAASHDGEDVHVGVVRRILAAAGLDERALQNTPDLPLSQAATRRVLRAGGAADRLRQNCSGNHAAMLATCVANSWPQDSYLDPDHPVQLAVRSAVERLAGEQVAATAVDGCGAPVFAVSLLGVARAFTALVDHPVADAMRARPDLVGGEERDVTRLMQAVPGLVAKDGAEGVFAAAVADRGAVAVKIDDGGGRARTPVLIAALTRLGVAAEALSDLSTVPVMGHGRTVGKVTVVQAQ